MKIADNYGAGWREPFKVFIVKNDLHLEGGILSEWEFMNDGAGYVRTR